MVNISKIRTLLKEHGWSASYFCRSFGKGVTWLADMERGRGLPDENTLQDIADKLDTTTDYLTDKTDKKEKPASGEPDITFDDFTYAFLDESKELTEEDKQKLLEMARFFKQQQEKKKKEK